jgi:hypothetical protein
MQRLDANPGALGNFTDFQNRRSFRLHDFA